MSSEVTLLLRSTRTHTHRGPSAAAFPLFDHRRPQEPLLIMQPSYLLLFCLLLVSQGSSAVITGACERDSQCGGSMCCAVSLWIRSLRMCTPMGQEGEECHPLSHKVPFLGKRLHHTCPCLPHLACITTEEGKSKCLSPLKNPDYYL